jgi:hypothetical protein
MSPASNRSSVVLPQPEGPTTHRNSPSATSKLKSEKTRRVLAPNPNEIATPRTPTAIADPAGALAGGAGTISKFLANADYLPRMMHKYRTQGEVATQVSAESNVLHHFHVG